MTSLSDFPPDVQATAKRVWAEMLTVNHDAPTFEAQRDVEEIAAAIMAGRQQRIDTRYLTARQADCLRFVAQYQFENDGLTPSFDQIKDALGLSSKSGVTRLLDGLEDRGRVKRLPGRSRAITIISTPAS
jgi:DNA-binding MarR family transcriptional regulator